MKRSRPKKLSRRFWALFTVVASTSLSLGVAELFVRYKFFSETVRQAGADALWAAYQNGYTRKLDSQGCSFPEKVQPHPFLVFAHRRTGPCGIPLTNNIGTLSRWTMPDERDPNFFTIMIVGGSVAAHLGIGAEPHSREDIWLANVLNEKYISPNGKPFRVINGALGGWSYPNQAIMTLLYGDAIDAVVAVDGYNEASHSSKGGKISLPDVATYLATARPQGSFPIHFSIWVLQSMRSAAESLVFVRKSFFIFFAFQRIAAKVDQSLYLRSLQGELVTQNFYFTRDYSAEKRNDWNRKALRSYVRQMRALASAHNILYAHFLQPTRTHGKILTEAEKKYVEYIDARVFESVFIRGFREMAREGLPVFSLTNVFQDERGTIFDDNIHCKYDENGDNYGYRLMSARIARDLAHAWKLRPKR